MRSTEQELQDRTPSQEVFARALFKDKLSPFLADVRAKLRNGEPVLTKNTDTRLHRLAEASTSNKVILANGCISKIDASDIANIKPFIVAHNWAAAFADVASDAYKELRAPYPACAFEFLVLGRSVICLVFDDESGRVTIRLMLDLDDAWFVVNSGDQGNEQQAEFFVHIIHQAKATLLAIDAQLAVRNLVRAPIALNRKRQSSGRHPVYDHHVVDLCPKAKADRFDGGGTHASPRLHFRRGHWRHFTTHRTWISACLVGNPDLGFLSKHYVV